MPLLYFRSLLVLTNPRVDIRGGAAGGRDEVVPGHVPHAVDLAVVGDLHPQLNLANAIHQGVAARLVLLLVVVRGGDGGVDDRRLRGRLRGGGGGDGGPVVEVDDAAGPVHEALDCGDFQVEIGNGTKRAREL